MKENKYFNRYHEVLLLGQFPSKMGLGCTVTVSMDYSNDHIIADISYASEDATRMHEC